MLEFRLFFANCPRRLATSPCSLVTSAANRTTFVAEPQTNGVAERFNRTLKEQVIHGRLFCNLEEVRAAVTAFRDRYNRHWRLENEVSAKPKTGLHVTPRSPSGLCHAKGGLSCKTVSR